jgi:hypothetical protein
MFHQIFAGESIKIERLHSIFLIIELFYSVFGKQNIDALFFLFGRRSVLFLIGELYECRM